MAEVGVPPPRRHNRVANAAAVAALVVVAFGLATSLRSTAFAAVAPASSAQRSAGATTARAIWLHGLGDTAEGWAFLPKLLESKGFDYVDFVLPTALSIPITVNGGMYMPGWFDMDQIPYSSASTDDRSSIEAIGVKQLTSLIQAAEADGVPADRVVVGGFSQGACVAMMTGLSYPRTLAGVASLSGWVPAYARADAAEVIASEASGPRPPVLWGHGEADEIVKFEVARVGPAALRAVGMEVDFRGVPGLAHGVAEEELEWLVEWLQQRLPRL
mmetsp:Transcript_25334/g.67267  ORF Transcript_25334/g.67267 Transcript_25334/m.67267 type:complete len:273 (-) Transcript_25334:153-971(-)